MAKKKIVGTVTVNDIDRPHETVVTAVQVFPFKDTGNTLGHIKGLASIVLNDALTIRGLRIMDGENGLFVGYPLDPFYKGDECRSIVFPMTRELREHIENCVLEKYQAVNV
jgi:stage V sporulation protein G